MIIIMIKLIVMKNLNVIQKVKLNLTHSVNLGPIIVNIITNNKNKIDVPVVTELAISCLQSQHFNRLVIF